MHNTKQHYGTQHCISLHSTALDKSAVYLEEYTLSLSDGLLTARVQLHHRNLPGVNLKIKLDVTNCTLHTARCTLHAARCTQCTPHAAHS